jgi:GT2 family glycosyltransferase
MSRVTTVVATRNRWSDLEATLPLQSAPVILVDNASDDRTPVRVRAAFPQVSVIELDANAGAVARNVGVAAATTPYVAFADDDSWWAPGALDRAADLFDAHPRLGLIAAHILVGPDQLPDPACLEMARSPLPSRDETPVPGRAVLGFVACGSVVRRRAYLEAGGFDEVVEFAGEEERLALDLAALGWDLAYVDDVVAHHHPSAVREGSTARQARLARNRLLTALMRRPWPVVAGTVWSLARGDGPDRRGIALAVPRARRALRSRRVVPAAVETQLRLVEGRWHGTGKPGYPLTSSRSSTRGELMPGRQELPSTLERSPKKAQRTWIKAHDAAVEEYGEGERAHRTAFSALKHSFEKVGDHWEPKEESGPSDRQAERSGGPARRGGRTAGGVDANASKRHLMEVAKKLDISGRSRMTKDQLVDAIQKANAAETRRSRSRSTGS